MIFISRNKNMHTAVDKSPKCDNKFENKGKESVTC